MFDNEYIKGMKEQIEEITKGERFITPEQMEELMELSGTYSENLGASGTGKGTWYNIYLTNENGEQTETKVAEVVELYQSKDD